MRASPRATVVLVTYNSEKDIIGCIESLGESKHFEVIVVDNQSTDRSLHLARELQAQGLVSLVIASEENDGFARAVNRGIRAAGPGGIFLLNPDARIHGADIDRLIETGESDPTIGIVAPLVDSGPQVPTLAAGLQPRIWPLFTHFTGLARALPKVQLFRGRHLYRRHHSYAQDVEWVSGCALYLTSAARSAVELLSERWFMYGEDIELADRVARAGFRIRLEARIVATHEIGASVNASGSSVSTLWAENTYDFYVWRFSPGPIRRLLWRSIFSAGLWSRATVLRIRARRSSTDVRDSLLARAARFDRFAGAVWKARPTR